MKERLLAYVKRFYKGKLLNAPKERLLKPGCSAPTESPYWSKKTGKITIK